MNKCRIVVYDKTRGFFRFLKSYFSNIHDIYLWNSGSKDYTFLKEFDIAFIQIHSYDDLIEALVLAHHVKYVFWSSSIKEVKESFVNVEDFVYLDMELDRKTLKLIISNSIDMLS